jgi:ParB family transcriptional regulator, chromosome partitioning protein
MSGALLQGAELLELSPFDIDPGERIGFTHEDKAAALGRLMAVDGQRDPIKVVRAGKDIEKLAAEGKKPWRLVTGMHRLLGARIESLTVFAIEVSGKPEDLADLEASENLHRRPLGPIERAKFTAALVHAAQARIAGEHGNLSHQRLGAKARWDRVKHGEQLVGKALRDETEDACATVAQAYGWEESVSEALGMSRRTIHRDLALFRLLIEPFPNLIEALSRHPVVGDDLAQLKAIAAVQNEGKRRQVIEALLADPEIGADDARITAGVNEPAGPTPVAYQKHLNAIEGGWSRLSVEVRNRFVRDKLPSLLTPGQKRELRDLLDSELGVSPAAPRKVGVAQAASTLSETIRVMNALIEGEEVNDEELQELRAKAQLVVFDIPEEAPRAR